MNENTLVRDNLVSRMQADRGHHDRSRLVGRVVAEMKGPDGNLKSRCEVPNLITAVGDQYYAARAALATGLPAQVTGFRLGTGSTAPAKTGAGAAIVTYLATSNKAPSSTPTVVGGVVTYQRIYAAGEATSASTPITEVVLNNDTIANDNATTATAANTISRALLTGIGSKQAGDTLTITWTHTLLGA